MMLLWTIESERTQIIFLGLPLVRALCPHTAVWCFILLSPSCCVILHTAVWYFILLCDTSYCCPHPAVWYFIHTTVPVLLCDTSYCCPRPAVWYFIHTDWLDGFNCCFRQLCMRFCATCMLACVRACVHVCVCVRLRACVHMWQSFTHHNSCRCSVHKYRHSLYCSSVGT